MDDGRIATRYAKALLLWATSHGCSREVYDAARTVLPVLFSRSVELSRRLGDRVVSEGQKLRFVEELFGGYSDGLTRLGTLMVVNGRGAYLVRAVGVFLDLYERRERILPVEVWSARPIEGDRRERLEGYMRAEFGDRIEPRYFIDSGLIGGFQLFVDGRRYDRSVRGDLQRMALLLKG